MKLANKIKDTGNVYFISDLHYNHENVMKMNSRNFQSVGEMNSYILQELKSVLKPGDILFELGDFFWRMKSDECDSVLSQIPTQNIYKIIGNHDKLGYYYGGKGGSLSKHFLLTTDVLDITIEHEGIDYMVTLMHYPCIDWNHMYHGSLHIHGHTHGNIDAFEDSIPQLMVDVGFDAKICKNYGSFIIPFGEILRYFKEKTGGMDFTKWAKEKYD